MSLTVPINNRSGDVVFCTHCHTEQKEAEGIRMADYFFYQNRLDDGLSQIEEKYFNEKYMTCSYCGNICEMFSMDNTKYFDKPEIQEILLKNIPQTEKNFLVMNIIKNSYESLIDLYHYYQFVNDDENTKYWRERLLGFYEENFKKTKSLHSLRMLIELNRRNGDFEKALKLIKTEYKKVKNLDKNNKFVRDLGYTFEHEKIEQEKKLCKAKNNSIAIFELPKKYKLHT